VGGGAKSVMPVFHKVLDETMKMVHQIKNWPLHSMLFSALRSPMEAPYTQLLLHREVRWLSWEWVVSKFYELKEELTFFFLHLKGVS
jgi:hypothetical protein